MLLPFYCEREIRMPRKDPRALSPALSQNILQTDVPRLGGDAALTHIVAALGDVDPTVRLRAVEALDELGGSEAVTNLLLEALQDGNGSVQKRAARALGHIGGERVVSALQMVLTSESYTAARGEALQAMGRIGGAEGLEALMAFPDEWGNSGLKPDLRRAFRLLNEHDPDLLVARLAAMLPSESTSVCSKLVQIAQMAQPAGLVAPMMAFAADTSQSNQTRRTALRVLGAIGSAEASPLLIDLLRAGEKNLIKWVSDALANIKDRDAIPGLMGLLDHPNWQVRAWTAELLGKRKVAAAVPALIERMKDERKEVRAKAVRALGRIRSREALLAVVPALTDPIQQVRIEATGALQYAGTVPEVIPEIIRRFDDPTIKEHYPLGNVLYYAAIRNPQALLPYRDTFHRYLASPDPGLEHAMIVLMSFLDTLP